MPTLILGPEETNFAGQEGNNLDLRGCEENSLKFRDIGIPLRIALTGSTSSPSIVHIMEILGEHQTLDRLNINVD